VSGDAVTLNSENANVAGSITAQDIQRLPEVGRDPLRTTSPAPGVLGDNARVGRRTTPLSSLGPSNLAVLPTPASSRPKTSRRLALTASASPVTTMRIDGVSVNSLGLGGAAGRNSQPGIGQGGQGHHQHLLCRGWPKLWAQIKVISQNVRINSMGAVCWFSMTRA